MTRTFEKSTKFPVSVNALYDWHARKGAFERLVPPWEDICVVSSDHSISEGSKLIMELHRGPGWVTWEAWSLISWRGLEKPNWNVCSSLGIEEPHRTSRAILATAENP